jgi:hypothetical protein
MLSKFAPLYVKPIHFNIGFSRTLRSVFVIFLRECSLSPIFVHFRSLVYQPEVIRIERAPSLTSVVRPPSCSPSPPPPPAPHQNQHQHLVTADINTLGMPQPMPPLATSFQRYQPSFQYPQPPSWISSNMASGPRSFDDVDIALSNRRNPERVLMHQHSASNLAASGGTLPRLGKGFVQVIIERLLLPNIPGKN